MRLLFTLLLLFQLLLGNAQASVTSPDSTDTGIRDGRKNTYDFRSIQRN